MLKVAIFIAECGNPLCRRPHESGDPIVLESLMRDDRTPPVHGGYWMPACAGMTTQDCGMGMLTFTA